MLRVHYGHTYRTDDDMRLNSTEIARLFSQGPVVTMVVSAVGVGLGVGLPLGMGYKNIYSGYHITVTPSGNV